MAKVSIAAIIIARDEAELIANCIDTLRWCDEVVVVDNKSQDTTAELAAGLGAKVLTSDSHNFSQLRELPLKHVKSDWVVYIDADERVTPLLAQEIMVQIETTTANALSIRRDNYFYGQLLQAGGWECDWVTRVFRRSELAGWQGQVHEQPKFAGQAAQLHHPLWHFSHRSTQDNWRKSAEWTRIEAERLAVQGNRVTGLTLLRKTSLELLRRLVIKRGYRDGVVGWIESMVQAANRLLVYVQVWEMQRKPKLSQTYQELESNLSKLWQASRP